VDVIEWQSTTPARLVSGTERIRSAVLPEWSVLIDQIFD
jgi:hypothetical protein